MRKLCAVVLVLAGLALLMPRNLAAEYGIKGGLNLSKYAVTAESPYEWDSHSLMGFSIGAFASFNLTPKIALQPELHYVRFGEKESAPGGSDIIYREVLEYIHFPAIIKVKILEGDFTPIVFAGPYLNCLLKGTGTDYSVGGMELISYDVKPYHKKTVYGVTVGAGVEKRIKKCLLAFDVRYFLDLVRNDIADIEEPWSSKTRVLAVMFGCGF